VADQHITVMTPTGLTTLHVTEHDKLQFEPGAIWVRMAAAAPGLAQPLPGLSKRSVSEFRAAVARELAEYESTVDLEPTLRALSEWWSSFVTEAGDAWNKRRWLTEEFIAQWETQRTRLVAAFPLSAVQRRALVARARADQREAVEAAYLAESVRAQVRD